MKRFIVTTLAAIAHYLGIWYVLIRLLNSVKKRPILAVFTYHRVVDGGETDSFYMFYDRGLDYRAFELQLKTIKKYFNICDLDQFQAYVTGSETTDKPTALITFDDADSEFIKYALPVLKRHNCPAVMFAPTSYVGTRKRFWHVEISELIRNCVLTEWEDIRAGASVLQLPDNIKKYIDRPYPESYEDKRAIARGLNREFNDVSDNDVEQIIISWQALVSVESPVDIYCMDWDQLKQLSRANVTIESHTATHRKLARLNTDQIDNELLSSKETIETNLSVEVKAICYPQGSLSNEVARAAADSGYKLGFTTRPGALRYPLKGDELLNIPRYGLDSVNTVEVNYNLFRIALADFLEAAP